MILLTPKLSATIDLQIKNSAENWAKRDDQIIFWAFFSIECNYIRCDVKISCEKYISFINRSVRDVAEELGSQYIHLWIFQGLYQWTNWAVNGPVKDTRFTQQVKLNPDLLCKLLDLSYNNIVGQSLSP